MTTMSTYLRVYLSGSMAGRPAEQVRADRQLATRLMAKAGIHAVDPGASEKKLWKKGKKYKITFKFPVKIMKAFVDQDLWLIRHSDALLVMTGDNPSDGTWWELAYAKFIGLPVIMISPKRVNGEIVGWSNIMANDLVSDIKGAIKLIKRKYVTREKSRRTFFDSKIKNPKRPLNSNKKRKAKKAVKMRLTRKSK